MQDLQRLKDYQKRIYSALGKEWKEEYFHEHWYNTLLGYEWDNIAEMGYLEKSFCIMCGSDNLKSGYYRTPSFSYYKVKQPICDECWDRKGYEKVAEFQAKVKRKNRIGCYIFIIMLLVIIWLLFI